MTLQVEKIASETKDAESSVAIYRIISYPADYTLQVFHRMWMDDEIIIPTFQRAFVWSIQQASRLIESFLMGLPVPEVFLYKDSDGRHLVIDGQQRLRSVVGFIEGYFPDNRPGPGRPFYLRGVSRRWEGKSYNQLVEVDARRLRTSILRAILVEQVDPDDLTSVYHVFERLNTGGTALSPQEVRNCVYHGPFNDFALQVNRHSQEWRALMGTDSPDKRLRDVELLIRFLGLAEGYSLYTAPMKDFISAFMKTHMSSTDNLQYEELFNQTVQNVLNGLGRKPFHIRRGLNAAVFDAVMVAFARQDAPPGDVQRRYQKLLSDERFVKATRSNTTDTEVVKDRIDLARSFLFG
jgi:hypothetical protein